MDLGRARVRTGRDPGRRGAVHQRRRVGRRGLRAVRRHGRQRAGGDRHRPAGDDDPARGPVRPRRPAEDVGIGAILGAPFMLSTLAMAVLGLSALGYARGRRARRDGPVVGPAAGGDPVRPHVLPGGLPARADRRRLASGRLPVRAGHGADRPLRALRAPTFPHARRAADRSRDGGRGRGPAPLRPGLVPAIEPDPCEEGARETPAVGEHRADHRAR